MARENKSSALGLPLLKSPANLRACKQAVTMKKKWLAPEVRTVFPSYPAVQIIITRHNNDVFSNSQRLFFISSMTIAYKQVLLLK